MSTLGDVQYSVGINVGIGYQEYNRVSTCQKSDGFTSDLPIFIMVSPH